MPGRSSPPTQRPESRLVLLLLLAVLFAVYAPALRGGFVWDDDMYVVHNELLHTPDGLVRIWSSYFSAQPPVTQPAGGDSVLVPWLPKYGDYPLALTTYWVEYQLWDLLPVPYHLLNVLLHAVNTALFWMVLTRLEAPGALAAAAIFALHPLNAESVAWVAERKTLLSAAFSFAAVLCWLRFERERAGGAYVGTLLAATLAMLSKASSVTLPAILLVLSWWRYPVGLGASLLRLAPLAAVAVGVSCLTVWREHAGHSYTLPREAPLLYGALIAGRAAWFYASKVVWPHPLMPIYPRWSIDPAVPYQYAWPASVLAIGAALWWSIPCWGRAPLAALAVYMLGLLPTLGFVSFDFLRLSFVADHFSYPATAALIALATAAGTRGIALLRVPAAVARSAACVICAVFALLTFEQAQTFENGGTFWGHAFANNPASETVASNLSRFLFVNGRAEEAVRAARTGVREFPESVELHGVLGAALRALGEHGEAEVELKKTLALDPENTVARLNLGVLSFAQGNWREAIEHLELVPAGDVRRFLAERHIGLAFEHLGERGLGAQHLEAALRLNPSDSVAREALARLRGADADADADRQP